MHAIADQDGHGAQIRAAHPGIFWIDDGAGLSQTCQVFRGEYQTGVTTQQDGTWVNANIRTGHGNLGALYPQNGAGVNDALGLGLVSVRGLVSKDPSLLQ